MNDVVLEAVKSGLSGLEAKLEKSIEKYEGQLKEMGKVDDEVRSEVKALSEKFEKSITEIAQKLDRADAGAHEEYKSAGEQFVESDEYKAFASRKTNSVRVEVKNTVTADSATTTWEQQRQGVVPGNFAPLTIRQVIPSVTVSTDSVAALREASWTNSAREVAQTLAKPESDITFERYNVAIETVAHWIKVTTQLLADAPAVVSYINTRLRDGLAQRIDRQLLLGDGTSPNLSGLTDTGNFTAYSLAASGDTLVDAINKAKYQMWSVTGQMPDVAIVNPADWGAMERTRESAGAGAYLYGLPGMGAGVNPFGVRIVLSNHVPAGNFLVAAMSQAAVVYNRSGAVIEMGYVNDDFTKNLVTIRAEERLGLGVDRASLIYYGDFEL